MSNDMQFPCLLNLKIDLLNKFVCLLFSIQQQKTYSHITQINHIITKNKLIYLFIFNNIISG